MSAPGLFTACSLSSYPDALSEVSGAWRPLGTGTVGAGGIENYLAFRCTRDGHGQEGTHPNHGRMIREIDQWLCWIIGHYVEKARAAVDLSEVKAVGIDETSNRRGHEYITLFVDLSAKHLVFATPGKDVETITWPI